MAVAASSHPTLPAPSAIASQVTPTVGPSICLIMTLSQNLSLILFLCWWQILVQTMNLLWVCDPLHLPTCCWSTPREHARGLPRRHGQAMHWHNPACLLHLTVPVYTIIHGLHIGCQHMGILFAPSVMLDTG